MEIHENNEEEQQKDRLTLDEKKKKFDEYKHLLDKQVREREIFFFLIKKIFIFSSKLIWRQNAIILIKYEI